ncbi:MAG: hypothetical protein K2Y23_20830 [Cyanobacteria bacterium]|nr:hypothetical protein [Cyanobacteriota bacterium]
MSNTPGERINIDRRALLRTAGLLGVAGVMPPAVSSARAQGSASPMCVPASMPADLATPPAPAGLNSDDLVDNRFRITYERSIPATVAVLTQHFAALGERNLAGIADTLHFAFAVHEQFSIRMPVVVRRLR